MEDRRWKRGDAEEEVWQDEEKEGTSSSETLYHQHRARRGSELRDLLSTLSTMCAVSAVRLGGNEARGR